MKQILVVEDNENNQLVIDDIFRRYRKEYQLRFVQNGQQLWASLEQELPDMILLDMRLPGVSGWELAEQLKAKAETRHLPLIAVTAHAMKGDEERARAAGCNDFVTKPIQKQTLLDKVKQWMAQT
ncbi:response regulator [Deltaproteobacteria bacterium TL4]